MEIHSLSCCVSPCTRFLILSLGLQSPKSLLFGFLQQNLLTPDLELLNSRLVICNKAVAHKIILGIENVHFLIVMALILLGIQREKYVKVVISWVSLLNPRERKMNLLEIHFEKN